MRVWPILLRVLLSLSLIFNGSGVVLAGSHAHPEDAAAVQTAAETAERPAAAQPPCHEHHQADTSASSNAIDEPAEVLQALAIDDASTDCCQSGSCRCGCVHHSSFGFAGQSLRAVAIEHPVLTAVVWNRYAAPPLPHLIRPPIG